MTNEPLRRTPRTPSRQPERPDRPKIWAEGGQRPPFDLRATGRASLYMARTTLAPLLAWGARRTRQGAEAVRDGKARLQADRLGKAARFVPSHLRVAGWIQNTAAILAHASATADPDVTRGNALVSEIEPYLWAPAQPAPSEEPGPPPANPDPVVLPEPMQPGDDPLAAIRDDLGDEPTAPRGRGRMQAIMNGPALPPAPPGQVATTAIQITGYILGWVTTIVALPIGLAQALWQFAKGTDLRGIGRED